MEKTEFTMKRRALSNICTVLGFVGVSLLSNNLLVIALMAILLSFFFDVMFTKNGFSKIFKVLFTILVIVLIALMCYFKYKPEVPVQDPSAGNSAVIEQDTDKNEEEKPTTDDQQVIVSDTTEDNTSKKNNTKKWTYSALPDKMETSFGGSTENSSSSVKNGDAKVEGDAVDNVEGGPQTSNKELEDADKAKQEGKDTETLNKDVIAGADNTPKEEEKPIVKDESTRENPEDNKIKEVTQNVPTPSPSEDDKNTSDDKSKHEISSDELEDIANSVPKEEVKDNSKEESKEENKSEESNSQEEVKQPENSEGKTNQEVEQPSQTDKEEQADNVKPEEDKKEQPEDNTQTKPEEGKDVEQEENSNISEKTPEAEEKEEDVIIPTPVTITPLDGNQAYAGDSVQFKLTGDVGSVIGIDGFKYSMANGYLTVETNPNEATVLTVTIIGTDGVSTATTSVTVNVLNFNS
ncbi:MAG: hypothetical protein J6A15_07025 [Clostridia bacterium]|nr:hypothetical protein [Clostridia bacterium]